MSTTLLGIDLPDAAQELAALVIPRAGGLLALAFAAVFALRWASASLRHAVLAVSALLLIALPAVRLALPAWELPYLPASTEEVGVSPPRTGDSVVALGQSLADGRPAGQPPAAARPVNAAQSTADGPPEIAAAAPEATLAALLLNAWPSFPVVVLLLWCGVAAAALGHLALAHVSIARKARVAEPVNDADWLDDLADAAGTLGLPRPVHLAKNEALTVPLVYGWWSPVVLLPRSAAGWTSARRRSVLLHELAHVRRRDCLTQGLALVARSFYWPNPLAWWAVARLRAEAERACDDLVLSAGGVPAADYAGHLLEAAADLRGARRPSAVVAVIERSPLERRLAALLDPAAPRRAVTARGLATVAAIGGCALLAAAALQPVAMAGVDDAAPLAAPAPTVTLRVPVHEPSAQPAPSPITGSAARRVVGEVRRVLQPGGEPAEREPDAASYAPQEIELSSHEPAAGSLLTGPPAPVAAEPPSEQAASSALPDVPIIRISADLVQVDAVVTDKRGRHVAGLGAADFEVYQDGERQDIVHVAYVTTGLGPEAGASDAVDPSGGTKEPRTLVFVVDDLGLSPEAATWTRKLLLDYADGAPESDRVGLVVVSRQRDGAVSWDWGVPALRSTAESLRFNAWSRTSLGTRSGGAETARLDQQMGRADPDSTHLYQRMAYVSLAGLKGTVDALRPVRGRKAVVFLSQGFGQPPSNDPHGLLRHYTRQSLDALYDDRDVRAALRSMTDLANRASVVVYTMDPLGLVSGGLSAETSTALAGSNIPVAQGALSDFARRQQASLLMSLAERRQRVFSAQESLREIADETGGFAVIDNNELKAGLERILTDQAGYYLIGYEPREDTFAGRVRFHRLQVDVKRRGLQVRSRRGFYSVTDAVVARSAPVAP